MPLTLECPLVKYTQHSKVKGFLPLISKVDVLFILKQFPLDTRSEPAPNLLCAVEIVGLPITVIAWLFAISAKPLAVVNGIKILVDAGIAAWATMNGLNGLISIMPVYL